MKKHFASLSAADADASAGIGQHIYGGLPYRVDMDERGEVSG